MKIRVEQNLMTAAVSVDICYHLLYQFGLPCLFKIFKNLPDTTYFRDFEIEMIHGGSVVLINTQKVQHVIKSKLVLNKHSVLLPPLNKPPLIRPPLLP